jgi:hypothetical protein
MKHWNDVELIARIYGVGPDGMEHVRHFDSCAECQAKLLAMSARRALTTVEPPIPDSRLRAQREQIYRRLESGLSWRVWLRPVSAAACVAVLVAGWALHRPVPIAVPEASSPAATATISDEQLFTEIASVVNEQEPRAASPIRGLFAESQ